MNIALDVTRLAFRLNRRTPNGIDRVDASYLENFYNPNQSERYAIFGWPYPRLISGDTAKTISNIINNRWREDQSQIDDPILDSVIDFLNGSRETSKTAEYRNSRSPYWGFIKPGLWANKDVWNWRSAQQYAEKNTIYLNISQYPLWSQKQFSWLTYRHDVKGVFLIHDILPYEYPEYFLPSEAILFANSIRTLSKVARAVIVTSQNTKEGLSKLLEKHGQINFPIHVESLPIAKNFREPPTFDPRLSKHSYFVYCATIEPRKNHLLLLHIWRSFSRCSYAGEVPKLILIGSFGWENENVLDILNRSAGIKENVLHVTGMPTPTMKRLLDNCNGVLLPSFAEGFGLPMAEALHSKVPIVASDIPSFRAFAGANIRYLDPLDACGWKSSIIELMQKKTDVRFCYNASKSSSVYFDNIRGFLSSI